MKQTLILLCALLLLFQVNPIQGDRKAGTLREQLGDTLPGARWTYDDWEVAKKEARKTGRPIFAVFRCVP